MKRRKQRRQKMLVNTVKERTYNLVLFRKKITLLFIITIFNDPPPPPQERKILKSFPKYCGKRRKCLYLAFCPFPTMFYPSKNKFQVLSLVYSAVYSMLSISTRLKFCCVVKS